MIPYKHMNAAPLKPNKYWIKSSDLYRRQEKFKGIRAFAYVTPEGTTLITRGGKDCSRNFPHLTSAVGSFVLDGELWQEGIEDEVVAGWANSKYLTDDTSGVLFQCFDILEFRDLPLISLTQSVRDGYRLTSLAAINHPGFLCVPYLFGNPEDDFAQIVARGGEGQMYKHMHQPYMQRNGDNRPAGYWYKEKSVEDFDVVVVGFTEAKPGKFEGLIGAFTYGMMTGDNLAVLGNCSGMTTEKRIEMTYHPERFLGKVIEVKAAGQDENSGALIEPRYIRLRTDKLPTQCIWK